MANVVRRSRAGGVEVQVKFYGDTVTKIAERLANKSSYEIGLFVEGQAKDLAPVDTGRLRGSIQTSSYTGQKTSTQGERDIAPPTEPGETYVGTPVEYAPYMEYGTVRTPAQAYLRPALDIAKGRAPEILEVEGKKEFAEYLQ